MSNSLGRMFNEKRVASKRVFPHLHTRRRSAIVLPAAQAAEKMRITQLENLADRERLRLDGAFDTPVEVTVLKWPANPNDRDAIVEAIWDGFTTGNSRLTGPINERGDRQAIWRGNLTPLQISAEVCHQKFGIIPEDYDPQTFHSENAESIGLIEPV